MATTQISAHISTTAKARLDEVARLTGRSRQSILEDAILREAMALEEIPAEYLVPTRVVLGRAAARRVLELIDHPKKAGAALQAALRRGGGEP